MSENNTNMSHRFECIIPKWVSGPNGLRAYIDQLDETKNLGYFESEADLIYTSLCKSGRPELYSQLSTTEKESVQEFVQEHVVRTKLEFLKRTEKTL